LCEAWATRLSVGTDVAARERLIDSRNSLRAEGMEFSEKASLSQRCDEWKPYRYLHSREFNRIATLFRIHTNQFSESVAGRRRGRGLVTQGMSLIVCHVSTPLQDLGLPGLDAAWGGSLRTFSGESR
jgi:hypothetical protein